MHTYKEDIFENIDKSLNEFCLDKFSHKNSTYVPEIKTE